MTHDPFTHSHYLLRRKILKLFGAAFHVYDPAGNVVLYSKLKAFKLREDIRLYTGEDMAREILSIRARQIVDFAAAYDVVDSASGQSIGALQRRGFRSMLRDEWLMLDAAGREIGVIREDSTARALVRRFVDAATIFMPQKYHVEMNGMTVGTFQQHFNPFVFKMTVEFAPDGSGALDRRLGLAAATLISVIEGRQG